MADDDEVPAIDPFDPMMEHFALQFDLRERFLHALKMIAAVKPDGRHYKEALALVQEIAREAYDDETIGAWKASGRPLPWLDAEVGEDADAVEHVVREARSIAVV